MIIGNADAAQLAITVDIIYNTQLHKGARAWIGQ